MPSTVIKVLWILFQIIVGYNLVIPLLEFLLFQLRRRARPSARPSAERDYGIIITAYEQTHMVPAAVESILRMNYSNYMIYIVADKCDVTNLKFADNRVVVLRPETALNSNTRSHFYAIRHFRRPHEYLTIIDSDNLVDPNYIHELNVYFEKGFKAVQGVRKAKNLDTTYACLDAARDIYYHFYDGEVLFQIGSSATLAGSGMAFSTSLYCSCLEHTDITGAGFDKVLQASILERGERIAYAKNAIVYDEKTSRSDQLVKQRARWINTWFRYFNLGFRLIGNGVRKGSWNQFIFGVVLLRPPIFIFLLLSILCMLTDFAMHSHAAYVWLAAFFLFVSGFLIALVHSRPDRRIYKSLVNIPVFIFYQVLSLLKVRKANKYSVATQHYYVQKIDEL